MSDYVFVKASVCWADEFDCKMFGVFPTKEWEDLVEQTKLQFSNYKPEKDEYGYGGELEIGFGTNEALRVSDFKDWYENFEITPITKEEADILKKLFCPSYKKNKDSFTWGTGDYYFTGVLEQLSEKD